MSNAEDLKNYLIGSNESFLISPEHSGKTSMLSGEWGVGKTYYWKKEIHPQLSEKLKNSKKACVYVSLYGKDSLDTIKKEILYKAYSTYAEDISELKQKGLAAFGVSLQFLSSFSVLGANFDSSTLSDSLLKAAEAEKLAEGQSYLSDGGVICLDDFERKSKNIDLNDLFGFISQLSIEMNCKVVIILNSEVFEGTEKRVFNTVKEKTVNKFFSFNPSIDELFKVIFDNEKYKPLTKHKKLILDVIKETEELNARIYIQVLDNCLEWLTKGKQQIALRSLILCSINFIKNHFIFDTFKLQGGHSTYKIIKPFLEHTELGFYLKNTMPTETIGSDEVIHRIKSRISSQKNDGNNKSVDYYYQLQIDILMENKETIQAFYHYKYILKIDDGIDEELFQQVNNFVKSGILL